MPRTPEFDRQEVVTRAMHVFWQRGYGQTSVADLVTATGLQPGSIYAAFGSKKGVFIEVLNAYHREFIERIRALGRHGPVLEDIRQLLGAIVEDTACGRSRHGCLAVNALLELSQHEPDIAALLEKHNERIRAEFDRLFEQARVRGEIPFEKKPAEMSAFLVNNLWGMRVMCRGTPDRAAMIAVVNGILGGLEAR